MKPSAAESARSEGINREIPAAEEVDEAVNVFPERMAGSPLMVQPKLVPDAVKDETLPEVEAVKVKDVPFNSPETQPVKEPE